MAADSKFTKKKTLLLHFALASMETLLKIYTKQDETHTLHF